MYMPRKESEQSAACQKLIQWFILYLIIDSSSLTEADWGLSLPFSSSVELGRLIISIKLIIVIILEYLY
jgi:hypothetical protein